MVNGTSYFVYVGVTERNQELSRGQAQRLVEWASDALDKLSYKANELIASSKLYGMCCYVRGFTDQHYR